MAHTFAILSTAFSHEHPYIDAAFPNHDTPAGRVLGGERMLSIKTSDPNTTFLKIIDTEIGIMIAQARWNIYRDTIPLEADLASPDRDELPSRKRAGSSAENPSATRDHKVPRPGKSSGVEPKSSDSIDEDLDD
jgi:hypothetical protein